ncbi:MAG: endolytic transglycosylase MltG [Clostridia bacterium]|nr:endolytic transglycosylase MltG [Clostridia bacterium]
MKNFHITSIILGIGIGIVLTSIVSMIYLAGEKPKMSREEIINEAKKIGMLEGTELIGSKEATQIQMAQKPESTVKLKEVQQKESMPEQTKQEGTTATSSSVPKEQEIKIKVNPGDTSEIVSDRLLKAGLISDKAAFLKDLTAMGLTTEINIGEFNIKYGLDNRSIIKILTNRR